MNENDVFFQKVTQANSEKSNRKVFFPSMPLSLSGIIHHSHSFTRLEIYNHIYFNIVLIGHCNIFVARFTIDTLYFILYCKRWVHICSKVLI